MAEMAQILAQVERAEDPLEVLKAQIEEDGGLWLEADLQVRGIVELQLCGLVGIGPTVSAAADDWILQARERTRLATDDAA